MPMTSYLENLNQALEKPPGPDKFGLLENYDLSIALPITYSRSPE